MSDTPQPSPPNPAPLPCPICHAPLMASQRVCWLCQQALDRTTSAARTPLVAPPLNIPPPLPPPPPDYSFSLSTLMLVMTLIAVLSGLCKIAPGLGIPLSAVALVAWINTFHDTRQVTGITKGQKVAIFLRSFLLVTVISAGAIGAMLASLFAAFAALCYPWMGTGGHDEGYLYALGGACVAAVSITIAIFAGKTLSRVRPRDRFDNKL